MRGRPFLPRQHLDLLEIGTVIVGEKRTDHSDVNIFRSHVDELRVNWDENKSVIGVALKLK